MAGGILGGSDGIKGNIADILVDVFDRYDVEPGELNENINEAVKIVKEFAPVMRKMEDITKNIETDINDLQEQAEQFNKNSNELAEALDNVAESLDNFNSLVEEAAEKKEEQ